MGCSWMVVLLVCVGMCVGYNDTCSPISFSTGTRIYPNNVTYVYFAMPPTAASNVNITFSGLQFHGNVSVSVGYGTSQFNLSCPDEVTNNGTLSGSSVTFVLNNPEVEIYFFGVAYENPALANSTGWVLTPVHIGCPDWCRGPGAICNSLTGCMCEEGYYNQFTGCNVSGVCDPFANISNACGVTKGYGYQPCEYTNAEHTQTQWGSCIVEFCDSPYVIDHAANKCITNSTSSGHFQIPLSLGEFIGVLAAGSVFLVVVSVVITYAIMSRRHRYYAIH
eukprot:Phypoly_transcript_11559.p1 GENE.Phypoly_transcript_11559~~Phypoly_transcript_11559.p1  ORF type:complete len:286 (+),score=26.37 Phypoly_transcript_11559:27-860(+)